MADSLPAYLVGEKGVNLVASPLHTPESGLLSAQNVEFVRNFGIGGLGSRGGLSALNSVALAGSVIALSNVPLIFPSVVGLMVGLNQGDATNGWKTSGDGTTFVNVALTSLLRPAGIDKSPGALGAGAISSGQRAASFKGQFYFPGDDYIVDTSAPPFVVWNGTLSFTQFRIPNNPTSSGPARWIADTFINNGIIYLAVYDPGGVAPDQKGRVLAFDPSNGTLTEVGDRFGQAANENALGFPFCLTTYLGALWVGTYGVSGNNQGGVYAMTPGVDEEWTLDLTATLHNGYYMSLCPYQGQLYAATDADALGTAIVQVRTSLGVWTTSLSAPASNVSYFTGLFVFNNLLFCCWYKASTGACLIKKYDGSSWVTDLDVAATYVGKAPGLPFTYRGALYWPFLGGDTSASSTAGFLLKRTTGGVWSRPLNAVAMRGGLGQYQPL